jgi:hypothetical protein
MKAGSSQQGVSFAFDPHQEVIPNDDKDESLETIRRLS